MATTLELKDLPDEIRVIDASALGAVMFNEPGADEVARETADWSLLAPYLLPFETASLAARRLYS